MCKRVLNTYPDLVSFTVLSKGKKFLFLCFTAELSEAMLPIVSKHRHSVNVQVTFFEYQLLPLI